MWYIPFVGSSTLTIESEWELCQSRDGPRSPSEAKASICTSSWLYQPLSIHGKTYSSCKLQILDLPVCHYYFWHVLHFFFTSASMYCFMDLIFCFKLSPWRCWLLRSDWHWQRLKCMDIFNRLAQQIVWQESWILGRQLELISNRSTLWTNYGIRSLSKTRCDPLFLN